MARFEVILNGERVCIAGLDGDGALSATINCVRHPGLDEEFSMTVGGHGQYGPPQDRQRLVGWPAPLISVGDEIMIRVLADGEFDLPESMPATARESIEDPIFGHLDFNINAWDGSVEVSAPPFRCCHVHLWSDSDAPSESQRAGFTQFLSQHEHMWPSIAQALVRCHPSIDNVDALVRRIHPQFCVNMRPEGDELQLSYTFEGDPEMRAYYVTLRNGEIAEVCSAE